MSDVKRPALGGLAGGRDPARLDAPNEAVDGLKPPEFVGRGEIDRLWTMIFSLSPGIVG